MFNDVVNGHDNVNGHDVSLSVSCDSESDRKLSLSGDRFESFVEVIYHHYHLLSSFFIFIIINRIVISHDLSSFFYILD